MFDSKIVNDACVAVAINPLTPKSDRERYQMLETLAATENGRTSIRKRIASLQATIELLEQFAPQE